MLLAVTRPVSEAMSRCELTHLGAGRRSTSTWRARSIGAYERALADAGCAIVRVDAAPELPDAVFIEDAAVVFDEVAIVTRPGAVSRRAETAAVAGVLGRYRPLRFIAPPATMDGGDVLTVARDVFVGVSSRTNAAAVGQMRALLEPFGYRVHAVSVTGCLHLKSAVTALCRRSAAAERRVGRAPSVRAVRTGRRRSARAGRGEHRPRRAGARVSRRLPADPRTHRARRVRGPDGGRLGASQGRRRRHVLQPHLRRRAVEFAC